VFRWHGGQVSFVSPSDFDNAGSHIRSVARALAIALRAHLVGDEGEIYR